MLLSPDMQLPAALSASVCCSALNCLSSSAVASMPTMAWKKSVVALQPGGGPGPLRSTAAPAETAGPRRLGRQKEPRRAAVDGRAPRSEDVWIRQRHQVDRAIAQLDLDSSSFGIITALRHHMCLCGVRCAHRNCCQERNAQQCTFESAFGGTPRLRVVKVSRPPHSLAGDMRPPRLALAHHPGCAPLAVPALIHAGLAMV